MHNVSQEYKDSMKSALRDRGYIRIAFGGVNSAAQNNALISGGQISRSDPSEVFNNGLDDYVCATLEHNFTRVDGSMYFPTYGLEKAFIGDAFIEEIAAIDPDQLTPKDALDWLYKLVARARKLRCE